MLKQQAIMSKQRSTLSKQHSICRKNCSTCCFDIVAGVDGALQLVCSATITSHRYFRIPQRIQYTTCAHWSITVYTAICRKPSARSGAWSHGVVSVPCHQPIWFWSCQHHIRQGGTRAFAVAGPGHRIACSTQSVTVYRPMSSNIP